MPSHFVFNETWEDGKRQDGKKQRDFGPCEGLPLHDVLFLFFPARSPSAAVKKCRFSL